MVTMKRNGSFVIELINSIGSITELTLRPANIDIAERWGNDNIQSTMGLLSVLTGVAESDLVKLEYPDVDRVMAVLAIHLPVGIKAAIEQGNKPLTTPKAGIAPVNAHDEALPGDPVDPRFPAPPPGEKVQRWSSEKPPPEADDTSGFSTAPPQRASRKVG